VSECHGFHADAGAGAFISFVHSIRDRVLDSVQQHFEDLGMREKGLEYIQTRTLLGDKDSFMASAMADTYAKVQLISTTVSTTANGNKRQKISASREAHNDRVETIRKKFHGKGSQKALFDDIATRCKVAFKNVMNGYTDEETHERVDGWAEELKEIVSTGVKDILKDFDRRFAVDDEEVKREEDPEAKETLLKAAQEALATLNGPLDALVKDCEAYEKGTA
jgi:hypothetical protein